MALATKSPSVSIDALEGGGPGIINRVYGALRRAPIWIIVAIWTIPTLGLFVNSFRTRDQQRRLGWWQTMTSGTTEATAEEGEAAANTFSAGPFTMEQLTTENYETVLAASATTDLFGSLVNSAAIAIPATIIPIAIAAFAAYGFAWIDFKGRKPLFIGMVALLAVPLQVALRGQDTPLPDNTWVIADVVWLEPDVPYADSGLRIVEAEIVSIEPQPGVRKDPYESPY